MLEIANLLPPPTYEGDPVLEFEEGLEETAHALDLEPWVLQRLKHAEREITVNLPLVRDDGSVVNLTGYRIQHSRGQGPSIGPVTLSATAHAAALRTTAAQITFQSALLGLRLGGAAGAVVVDADQLSERELRRVVKDFVIAIHENTGPLSDVLACDGNSYIATWMEEANRRIRGKDEPAAVVGKTSDDAVLATACAGTVAALFRHALGTHTLKDARIAMQGFGRHGRALGSVLDGEGAHMVAIADRSGGLLCDSGIDLAGLGEFVAPKGVVFGFPGATAGSNSDVLGADCDVLILAAAQRQIGAHNAGRIRARVVIELAEGAVCSAAERELPTACLVVPHLIAGGAQLAVWAHEWQRGLSYSGPDEQRAESEATRLVVDALERAQRLARDRGITVREAALMLAVSRLASTLRLR